MAKLNCPHCQQLLSIQPEMAGNVIICPSCQNRIQLPPQQPVAPMQHTPQMPAPPQATASSPQSQFGSPGLQSPPGGQPQGYPLQQPGFQPQQMGGMWAGQQQQQPANRSKMPLIIVGSSFAGVLLIGLVITLVLVLSNNDEEKNQAAKSSDNSANTPVAGVAPSLTPTPRPTSVSPSPTPTPIVPSPTGRGVTGSPVSLPMSDGIPDEWAYVPKDSQLVVHMNVDQLMKSSLYQDLFEQLKGMLPLQLQPELDKIQKMAGTLVFGFQFPNNIFAMSDPTAMQFSGVLRTHQVSSLDDAIPVQMRQGNIREENYQGHTLLVATADQGLLVAYCQLDPKTILYGTKKTVEQLLGRGTNQVEISNELRAAAKQADFSSDVSLVVVLPAAIRSPIEAQAAEQGQPIQLPESLIAHAEVGRDIVINARAVCKDAATARQMQTLLAEVLREAQSGIADPQARSLVNSIRIVAAGNNVTGSLTIPGRLLTNALRDATSGGGIPSGPPSIP